MRKSSAMNIAKRLVRLVDKVPIAPESATRESLIDDMAKSRVNATFMGKDISYWQSAAFVTEMQEFLGGKHINTSMVGFMTSIWDEPYFKERTRKGGEVIIHNPYFTLLGCCTTEWMNTKLKQDVITDGFSRRCIFALETELNTLNPWPVTSEAQNAVLGELSKEALRIFSIAGLFEFTLGAREVYDAEYRRANELAEKHSPKVATYFSSRHILVCKICMCISAAIDSKRVVDSHMVRMAIKFLEQSERYLDKVFSGIGRNELKAYTDKVYDAIEKTGKTGIGKDGIYGVIDSDLTTPEINEAIEVLMVKKKITVTNVATSVQDPVSVMYRAVSIAELAPAEHLLRLARQLKPSQEGSMVSPAFSEPSRHLDPVTEKLLDSQAQKRLETGNGLLLKGTKSRVTDVRQIPLGKLD